MSLANLVRWSGLAPVLGRALVWLGYALWSATGETKQSGVLRSSVRW